MGWVYVSCIFYITSIIHISIPVFTFIKIISLISYASMKSSSNTLSSTFINHIQSVNSHPLFFTKSFSILEKKHARFISTYSSSLQNILYAFSNVFAKGSFVILIKSQQTSWWKSWWKSWSWSLGLSASHMLQRPHAPTPTCSSKNEIVALIN